MFSKTNPVSRIVCGCILMQIQNHVRIKNVKTFSIIKICSEDHVALAKVSVGSVVAAQHTKVFLFLCVCLCLNKVSSAMESKTKCWPNWWWLISLFQAHAQVAFITAQRGRIFSQGFCEKLNEESSVLMKPQREY